MWDKKAPLVRNEIITAVGPGDTEIAPGNMKRVALVISSPISTALFIRFGQPAAIGIGLNVPPNTQSLVLGYEDVGQAIYEPVHCVTSGSGQSAYVLDVFWG